MSTKVKVVEINEGRKINWKQSTTKLTFGDDELMVNCASYQRDWPVHLDICGDKDGNLVIGVGTGRFYAAQIDIPARKYTEPQPIETPVDYEAENRAAETDGMEQREEFTPPEPLPLEMSDVTLTLWAIDGLRN